MSKLTKILANEGTAKCKAAIQHHDVVIKATDDFDVYVLPLLYRCPMTQETFTNVEMWRYHHDETIKARYPHVVECTIPWGDMTHLEQFKQDHGLPQHDAIIMHHTGDFTSEIRLADAYDHLLPVLQATIDEYRGQWPTDEQVAAERDRALAAIRCD